MPSDFISLQIQSFRDRSKEDQQALQAFSRESPFDRLRREIQDQLIASEQYRSSILKNVTTFAGLSSEAILTAARSMEEVYFKKGENIIQQDDIGDSFFVLEEGQVSVLRKVNAKDSHEIPRELAKLGKNSHFGEISLLTAEPRSATITVISDEAKCLKMTKLKFDELLATTSKLQAESRKQIGRDVLETVPLFKTLTAANKKKLLEAMIPMTYLPSSYICRQGTTGNSFFILTEGTCKVTVNNQDGSEKEVAKLHPGDFFGEIALIEGNNRRTANVISIDSVSCLTLSRNDFNRLLKSLKVKLLEHQVMRSSGTNPSDSSDLRPSNALAQKRRISGFNTHGQRDETRIANLLKRFGKYTTEALWNSLYSRMFRDMLLDPQKLTEYGRFAQLIMRISENRFETVNSIIDQTIRILELDCSRRNNAENSFILGLMRQRNALKDRLCRNWPPHQYALLSKKVKFFRCKPFRKIIEVDSQGTTVFLILRGAVRIFSRLHRAGDGSGPSKVFYEEDLFPGDVFGESALSGMHTRMITALAITTVDLMVIDDQDFMTAQDRDTLHMGTEERSHFLLEIPLFRTWDSYKLLRLAHGLAQEEIENGAVIIEAGSTSKDLYFIVNGKVDIIDNLDKKNVITTLSKHDVFGESGFCNKFVKALNNKLQEDFTIIASSKVEVLLLQENSFTLFDPASIETIRSAFISKSEWRKQRVKQMKKERAIVRKQYHNMQVEADKMSAKIPEKSRTTFMSSSNKNQSNPAKIDGIALSRPGSPKIAGDIDDKGFLISPDIPSPTKPKQSNAFDDSPQFILTTNPADLAYQAALVHPLDDRLNNEKAWIVDDFLGNTDKSRLNNIEEIPNIMAKDIDLLMVASSCRDGKNFERIQEMVMKTKRPASAQKKSFSRLDHVQNQPSRPQSPLPAIIRTTMTRSTDSFEQDSPQMIINSLQNRPHTRSSFTSILSSPLNDPREFLSLKERKMNLSIEIPGQNNISSGPLSLDALRRKQEKEKSSKPKLQPAWTRLSQFHPVPDRKEPNQGPGTSRGSFDGHPSSAVHNQDSLQVDSYLNSTKVPSPTNIKNRPQSGNLSAIDRRAKSTTTPKKKEISLLESIANELQRDSKKKPKSFDISMGSKSSSSIYLPSPTLH